MSEPRDNTTEQDETSPVKNERAPGSYYYDDATGYEVYDPTQDEVEESERERGEDD